MEVDHARVSEQAITAAAAEAATISSEQLMTHAGNASLSPFLALLQARDVTALVTVAVTSVVAALFLYRFLLRPLLGLEGGANGRGGKRRHTVLIVGLPSSGKTELLQQLHAFDVNTGRLRDGVVLADSRTSTQANVESVLQGRYTVVDYPGHRRLRAGVFPHLREAATLVVVIDSVTIHDDKHEGAFAVAELLLSILTSAEFHGVKRLLFVCAKHDDITSYSKKAVKRLLETAMAASLQSQQGDLARVDTVVDAKGAVVGRGDKAKSGGAYRKGYALHLEADGTFSFDEQLDIPVEFVEVGCDRLSGGGHEEAAARDTASVKAVVDFLSS